MKIGKFIVIEGGVGCGKSTQAKMLAEKFNWKLFREPGGTEFGELVRDVLQERHTLTIDKRASLLGYMTCRANLIATEILPRLQNGENILLDRYWFSSEAYQGAEGVNRKDIRNIAKFATDGLMPDLVLFYDLDPKIGQFRKNLAKQEQDRYDLKNPDYHDKVRQIYHDMGRRLEPIRENIDANDTVINIFLKTKNILKKRKLI